MHASRAVLAKSQEPHPSPSLSASADVFAVSLLLLGCWLE